MDEQDAAASRLDREAPMPADEHRWADLRGGAATMGSGQMDSGMETSAGAVGPSAQSVTMEQMEGRLI